MPEGGPYIVTASQFHLMNGSIWVLVSPPCTWRAYDAVHVDLDVTVFEN